MGLCGSRAGSIPLPQKVLILSQTPLYTLEEKLADFAKLFEVGFYEIGTPIVKEGELGDRFYVIAKGEVDITAVDVSKSEIFLCSKKRGNFFGHAGLFDPNHIRNATVTATTDTECLEIDRAAFQKYVSKYGGREHLASIMAYNIEDQLKQIPFLQGLSELQLRLLGSLFEYETYNEDKIIFRQGDRGDDLYIILHGSVAVLAQGPDGEDTEITRLYDGSYFGEIALMVNMPRTATIETLEQTILLSLRKEDFHNFLGVVPDLQSSFNEVVKQRTAEQFKSFQVPFFSSIPNQLFHQLVQMCKIEETEPDQVIFHEGDKGDTFYIIIYGTLRVIKNFPEKGPTHIRDMGPGQYFGEIALVRNSERTASVIAKTRTVLLSFKKDKFDKFFHGREDMHADFELKLAKDECSVEGVLYHRVGLKYFTKHLANEYSSENLDFWKEVGVYRMMWPEIRMQEERKYQNLIESISETDLSTGSRRASKRLSAHRRSSDKQKTPQQMVREQHAKQLNEKEQKEHAREKAKEITEQYIVNNAPHQVNIPADQQAEIIRNVEAGNISPSTFDAARNEIQKLMARDSFKRFKTTELFQDLLREVGAYHHDDNDLDNIVAEPSVLPPLNSDSQTITMGDVNLQM